MGSLNLPDPALSYPASLAARRARGDTEGLRAADARDPVETVRTLSLHDVLDEAARAAGALLDAGVGSGDRVLLCVEAPDLFHAFLLGCMGIGAIAVPLPPPGGLKPAGALADRVTSVGADCDPVLAVTDDLDAWDRAQQPLRGLAAVLAHPADLDLQRDLGEVAFLQYTSGSTGAPRGVVVQHGNLVANLRAIALGAGMTAEDRSFSWLPLYHDMGLVGGLLLGQWLGIPTFVTAPRSFVTRPDSWMRAVSAHGATYTVAPNFAWEVISRKLPPRMLAGLDLSALRLAYNGAEPIARGTLDRVVDRYGPFGLRPEAVYPVYGLAEATLAAAFPRPGEGVVTDVVDRTALARGFAEPAEAGPTAVENVSVGWPLPDHEVRIVDPTTGAGRREREVGEIVIVGPSVTNGYYGRAASRDGVLRTGDLGYQHQGRLFVVDRLKDLIIVGGENYSPADLERVAGETPGLRRGRLAAFPVHGSDGTEAPCVVAELSPRTLRSLASIRGETRFRVRGTLGLELHDVVLVPAGALPRTSSGKIRRQACRQLYDSGAWSEATAWDRLDGLARTLRHQVFGWVAQ